MWFVEGKLGWPSAAPRARELRSGAWEQDRSGRPQKRSSGSWWGRLSRADPLSDDVGPVHLAGCFVYPFFAAAIVNVVANWCGDRLMNAEAARGGKRRYLVALCLLLTGAGLLIPPPVPSLGGVIALVTIAVSFANVGPAANGALVSDLPRSPADAGRAFAFLALGGNTFGLLAPIVTGHLVEWTKSFNSAFIAAGLLALIGAAASTNPRRRHDRGVAEGGFGSSGPRASRTFALPISLAALGCGSVHCVRRCLGREIPRPNEHQRDH